jgi:catechol 2,3-dioxygenase-like lactoylglutathione lyase family enzyme
MFGFTKHTLFDGWKFLLIAQTILLAGFILYACGEKSSSQEIKERKEMKINSFDGVTIIVKDFEAQKKFYRDVLGLPVESEYSDAIFFKIGDKKLGLFAKGHHKEGDASLEGASKGISHFEFGVSGETSELLSEKLKKAGFHAYRDVFKDADGNLFHFNLDEKVNY